MGHWSFYFLLKVGLFWAQSIGLHWGANVLFALALLVPLPQSRQALHRLRSILAWPVAVALFWYDANWPSPLRLVEQWSALSQFTGAYLLELLGRLISLKMLAAVLLAAGVHAWLTRRVRMGVVALVAVALAPLLPWPGADAPPGFDVEIAHAAASSPATAGNATHGVGNGEVLPLSPLATRPAGPPLDAARLDQWLKAFNDQESRRGVDLGGDRGNAPAFDLVLLSVCSLAWDDLAVARLTDTPFLRRFDLLFRQFNSAASYSGPAVLRLLHGSCGQLPQAELYGSAPPECYLFRQLARLGYRSTLLLNHDGHFDGFAGQLQQQGGTGLKPTVGRSAPVTMHSFDGSPVYDDYEVLSRWWRAGSSSSEALSAPRAVLYNTISLHDGNRLQGQSGGNSAGSWPGRARKLFADLERVFDLIEQSARPTVVVLVPEHGAALRGDATQIPGLREFPTPAITHVPAGVALLGFGKRPTGQGPVMVDQVSSYTSLIAVVAGLLREPEQPWTVLTEMARALPSTSWVAENDGTVLVTQGGRSYLRSRNGSWNEYGMFR